jgi:hypothetical protein
MEIAVIPNGLLRLMRVPVHLRYDFNVLCTAVFGLVFIYMASSHLDLLSRIPHVCLIEYLTSTPCIGCGVTGSVLSLFYGDVALACSQNAGGPVFVLATIFQLPLRCLSIGKLLRPNTVHGLSRIMTAIVVTALMANWAASFYNF